MTGINAVQVMNLKGDAKCSESELNLPSGPSGEQWINDKARKMNNATEMMVKLLRFTVY